MHALVNGYRVPLDVSFALRATGDRGARFLTARSRGTLCLSAHDPPLRPLYASAAGRAGSAWP